MTLDGAASRQVETAAHGTRSELTDVFAGALGRLAERGVERLRANARSFSASSFAAQVAKPGLLVVQADWVAVIEAAGLYDTLVGGYDSIEAAVAATELPVGLTVAADPTIAARAHVRAISTWGANFQADVADVVARGITDGLSVDEIAGALRAEVEGIDGTRGRTIARTEANAAMNAGRSYVHDLGGGAYKQAWVATPDSRVRVEHAAANGQVIDKDQLFSVGGDRLRYPGDPDASTANRVNCRCTVAMSYDGWSTDDLTANHREWSDRVRASAAADGLQIGDDLAGLLA